MNSFTVPPPPSIKPTLSVVPIVRLSKAPAITAGTTKAPPPPVPTPRVVNAANRIAVAAYKVFGLLALTVIAGGLLSYLAVHAFFFGNTSWVLPTALSPNDERVLRVDSMMAQEGTRRDALLTERLDLDSQLANARRVDATEAAFQASFKAALDTDLSNRKEALSRFQGLLTHYEHAKAEIFDARKAYAGMSKGQISDDFTAHLIDKDQMINGNFQLAELAGADLALRQRGAEVADRVSTLGHDVRALRAATRNGEVKNAALSYEMLRTQHEYDISVMTSQRARDDVQRLQQSITIVDKSVSDYDRMIQKLASSPFALAGDQRSTVIFVPYENLGKVAEGMPVYGCAVSLVACTNVGTVGPAIDGEVIEKHPISGRDMRGVMMHVVLRDNRAGQKPVLHIGRKPLFI